MDPTIHVIVKVMTKVVLTLALAAAVVGLPLAGLHCDDSGPAAMPCCKDKSSGCNQPSTTADCCRKPPIDKDASAGPTLRLAGKPQWTSVIGLEALVPSVPILVGLAPSLAVSLSHRIAWPDPPSPPLSILRV